MYYYILSSWVDGIVLLKNIKSRMVYECLYYFKGKKGLVDRIYLQNIQLEIVFCYCQRIMGPGINQLTQQPPWARCEIPGDIRSQDIRSDGGREEDNSYCPTCLGPRVGMSINPEVNPRQPQPVHIHRLETPRRASTTSSLIKNQTTVFNLRLQR